MIKYGILMAALAALLFGVVQAASINVGPDESIQMAIYSANPGDIIEVSSGTYGENLQIDKPLSLRGIDSGQGMPLIDARYLGSGVTLVADGITLEGFRVVNSPSPILKQGMLSLPVLSDAGIKVLSNGNVIRGNNVSDSYEGILLLNCSNNTVIDNDVTRSFFTGILINNSYDTLIAGNSVSYSLIGIATGGYSFNNSISLNDVANTFAGIGLGGSSSKNNATYNKLNNVSIGISIAENSSSNALNGNVIIARNYGSLDYYVGDVVVQKGENNDKGIAGIIVRDTSDNHIQSNTVSNALTGFSVLNSKNNTLVGNSAMANNIGIYLQESDSNRIIANAVTGNEESISLQKSSHNQIVVNILMLNELAISLENASTNNSIVGNNMQMNLIGLVSDGSAKNSIYYNNFASMVGNAQSRDSANYWNSTSPKTYEYNNTTFVGYMGNYWSDYRGEDANGNGIGETPYIVGSERDLHPRIDPPANYTTGMLA